MAASNKSMVLGFMTVRDCERGGLRGGYLLTTDYGRPLEFHYTSEVRVTGPQRVLHGADLDEYLYSEAIGKPMTDRQTKAPKIILVDKVQLLALRRLIPAPVVWLAPGEESAASVAADAETADGMETQLTFTVEGEEDEPADEQGNEPQAVAVASVQRVCHADFPQDLQAFEKLQNLLPTNFDWLEPFERVQRALAEIKDPDNRLVA